MAAPGTEAPRVKIPVGEVAIAAYRAVFGRLGLVLDLAWLPLLILLAVELAPGVAQYLRPASPAAATLSGIEEVVETPVALLCLSAFGVRWYRTLLFREQRALPRRLFVAAWLRFLAYALVLYSPIMAPLAAFGLWARSPGGDMAMQPLAEAAAALALIASLAVARLSLVFPAAACGAPMGLAAAWRQMRGNTWRLIAATLLVCAPIFIVVSLILSAILQAANIRLDELPAQPPLGLFLLSSVVDVVLNFLFFALGAAILAEFYRRIVPAAANEGRRQR